MNALPPLYKVNENGALQSWAISVEPLGGPGWVVNQGIIITRWGQEGGAFQETREVVKEGKNPGKKNATTPYEQACKDAKSKWEKQQKARKYVADRDAALKGERSELVLGGIDCMLAFSIEKKPNALKFPCAIQRKYDGHRMLAHVKGGICTLWSRTRKQIVSMPHIARALAALFPTGEFWLDGECYTMKLSFEDLTSFIRASEPQPGHEVVEYHIYDTAREGVPFMARNDWLVRNIGGVPHPLMLAPTVIVQNEDQMQECFENFLAAGYEGAMARNLNGLYVGKRTPDLLKLKKFQDAEYEVCDVGTETRTVRDSAGEREMVYAKFTCKLDGWTGRGDKAHEFTTTMNGNQAVQEGILASPHRYLNKLLTVKFQDLTKDGKPRFPKGLRFREEV